MAQPSSNRGNPGAHGDRPLGDYFARVSCCTASRFLSEALPNAKNVLWPARGCEVMKCAGRCNSHDGCRGRNRENRRIPPQRCDGVDTIMHPSRMPCAPQTATLRVQLYKNAVPVPSNPVSNEPGESRRPEAGSGSPTRASLALSLALLAQMTSRLIVSASDIRLLARGQSRSRCHSGCIGAAPRGPPGPSPSPQNAAFGPLLKFLAAFMLHWQHTPCAPRMPAET